MRLAISIEQTKAVFQYDPDTGDQWRVTDQGDCEDFVLSVLHRFWGKPNRLKFYWRLLTGEARIYYVLVHRDGKEVGHAIGRVDGWWFDNTCDRPMSWTPLANQTKIVSEPVRYSRLQIIRKLIAGRIL